MEHATDGRAGRPARRRNGRPDMGRTATTGRRVAFTLVEMIIVIGIIALLAGLLLQAVMKARSVGPRTQTKHEIGQLGIGVETFKTTYDVKYLPSIFVLSSDYGNLP